MSTPKKPRSDAKLKTLPEDRQREIFEKLKVESLQAVRSWLWDDGIETSLPALSDFFSWYQLQEQFVQNESDVETILEMLKTEQPGISQEKLFQKGQEIFSLLSIKQKNDEAWARVQRLNQRQEVVGLAKKKFQRETVDLFIEWVQNRKAVEIATSNTPKADRTEKIGQLIFKEDW